MICEKCGFNGEFITEEYAQNTLTFCPECYNQKTEWCKHEKNNTIKYLLNGNYRVQNMCASCFKLNGHYLKQSGLDLSKIKEISKERHDTYQDEQGEKYRLRSLRLFDMSKEFNKTIWFKEHDEYLRTIEWAGKRDEVLKRDSYLCQSCLTHKATQVHHLTYKHWRHEPLFELVSVCAECHEEITRLDQNNTLIS